MQYGNFIIKALVSTLSQIYKLFFFLPHRLFTRLACFLSASPNCCSRCVLLWLSLCYVHWFSWWYFVFYHASFDQVSPYPLKDQGSYQCRAYNWNCRNVHSVNYSTMQTTVQVNCNFSQCNVSIQVFLFTNSKVGICVDQSAVSFKNLSFILKLSWVYIKSCALMYISRWNFGENYIQSFLYFFLCCEE